MRTALVIGASRGIGREYVNQLLSCGCKVIATARDDASITALRSAGAEAIKLDVERAESLAGLGWQLDGTKLDLAIYVAGVYGSGNGATEPPTQEEFDRVMRTNVLGPMQLIPTIAPMVEAAHGKFIFISSGMGSIGAASASNGWVYRASKAALNMAVKAASIDYSRAVMVALSPGWVRTDMGGPDASTTVEQSVSSMLNVIDGLKPGDSGSYRDYSGQHLPW